MSPCPRRERRDVTIEAVAEALALGSRAGLDTAALLRVLGGGVGRYGVIEAANRQTNSGAGT